MTISCTDPGGFGEPDSLLRGSMGNMASDADLATLRSVLAMDYSKFDMIAQTRVADETQDATLFCWRLGLVCRNGYGENIHGYGSACICIKSVHGS